MKPNTLNVADVLILADMIERSLSAMYNTAPVTLAALGGREALARICEMTCIGPIARLDNETWARLSNEYEDCRRGH